MSAGIGTEPGARLQTRPMRKVAREVGVMILALVLGGGMAVANYPGGSGPEKFAAWLGMAGEVVMAQCMAILGVQISMLIASYFFFIGKQIDAPPRFVARTRRLLGYWAEVMAVCMVPTLTLVVAGCIRQPQLAGMLFAVLPFAGLVFILALLLGSLAIEEDELRIEKAQKSLLWTTAKLEGLRNTGKKLWPMIIAANAGGFGIVGLIAFMVMAEGPPETLGRGLMIVLLSAVWGLTVTVVLMTGRQLGLTSEDVSGRLLSSSLPILLWASIATNLLAQFGEDSSRLGLLGSVVMTAVAIAATVSVYRPLKNAPVSRVPWATSAVAQGMAIIELERAQDRATATLRELAQAEKIVVPVMIDHQGHPPLSLRMRIRRALQDWRS